MTKENAAGFFIGGFEPETRGMVHVILPEGDKVLYTIVKVSQEVLSAVQRSEGTAWKDAILSYGKKDSGLTAEQVGRVIASEIHQSVCPIVPDLNASEGMRRY